MVFVAVDQVAILSLDNVAEEAIVVDKITPRTTNDAQVFVCSRINETEVYVVQDKEVSVHLG